VALYTPRCAPKELTNKLRSHYAAGGKAHILEGGRDGMGGRQRILLPRHTWRTTPACFPLSL